jgi:hypothetical protein
MPRSGFGSTIMNGRTRQMAACHRKNADGSMTSTLAVN